MPRFEAGPDTRPGVDLPYGFFRPGQAFEWEQKRLGQLRPSLKYRPLDREAYDLLVKAHSAEAVKALYGEGPVLATKPLTRSELAEAEQKQLSERVKADTKGVRAADR